MAFTYKIIINIIQYNIVDSAKDHKYIKKSQSDICTIPIELGEHSGHAWLIGTLNRNSCNGYRSVSNLPSLYGYDRTGTPESGIPIWDP